jgi:hypothetical protein
MKFLKKFENYAAEPQTAPAKPKTKPGTRPAPSRPSPIRRHKPAVDPRPKAELDDVLDLFNLVASDEDKKEIESYYGKRSN